MAETLSTDPRRITAEHNVEAILDGVEHLLRGGRQPSISAVASEAGVSRPTVYSHFKDRRQILEALVERTVRRSMAAVDAAQTDQGPAEEALERLIAASWRELATHEAIAHAAASALSAEAMRSTHHSARTVIERLIERGRREGSFRTDVPGAWLASASLALIHAAAEEVRGGDLDPEAALRTLSLTIPELFRGPAGTATDVKRAKRSRR